jgi:hypothetical protein
MHPLGHELKGKSVDNILREQEPKPAPPEPEQLPMGTRAGL